jgi:putative toxin-antitoxin system antitoxin component (TIGR02293 family)
MKKRLEHKSPKLAAKGCSAAAEPKAAYSAPGAAAGGDIDLIRNGVRYHLMHTVQKEYDLSDKLFARCIGISNKTYSRLKASNGKLSPLSADRVYRLKKIRELAAKVLESPENAMSWLRRPQPGLGGAVPLELLDTEPGYEQVQLLLNQLEYGVLP